MSKNTIVENLIYITIFLLPAYLLRFSIFGIPTNLLEFLMLISFLVWLKEKRLKVGLKVFFEKNKNFTLAIFLIGIGLVISTLTGGNYKTALGIIKGWFVFPILFAFITQDTLDNKEKKEKAILAFYWSAVLVASSGAAYFLLGMLSYDGRLESFFNSPNYLAMYLSPAVLIGAVNLKTKVNRISLIIILFAFYLTYSYAAWAAAAVSLIGLFLISKNKFLKSKTIIITLLTIAIIISAQTNKQKFNDFIHFSERSSVQSRFIIWNTSVEILKNNWVLGIGPGNFQNKYLEYQKYFPPYLEWAVPHPHNIFLAFWLFSGILGLIGFLSVIFIWYSKLATKEKQQYHHILLAIVFYFLLHGLVDTTYFKNDLAGIFWLAIFLGL